MSNNRSDTNRTGYATAITLKPDSTTIDMVKSLINRVILLHSRISITTAMFPKIVSD